MTADDFTAWMRVMGFNIGEAADALGLGRNTAGRYAKDGAPLTVALACAALAGGLRPWAMA